MSVVCKMFSKYKSKDITIPIVKIDNSEIPKISVVLPVFNQQIGIVNVIQALIKSMSLSFELIVIDDASEDDSLAEVLEICADEYSKNLANFFGYSVYQNAKSRFETYCDNFGFSVAKGEFLLEIQSDIVINDYGFDKRFFRAMEVFPELFAISGRGTEPMDAITRDFLANHENFNNPHFMLLKSILNHVKRRTKASYRSFFLSIPKNLNSAKLEEFFVESKDFGTTGRAGRLGYDLFKPHLIGSVEKSLIYFGDTIMRGPLFLRKTMYLQLGGLNTHAFFQGFDEHDLFCRARIERNWRVAYSPVDFTSPISMGTTRKPRSLKQEIAFLKANKRVHRNHSESILYTLGSTKMTWDKNLWFTKKF